MPSNFFMEMAKAEKEREAAREARRHERRFWGLDALPEHLSHAQKLAIQADRFGLEHSARMVAEGRLTDTEFNQVEAGVISKRVADLPTEDYARLTGRTRNQHGRFVESGEDQLTPMLRHVHRDDLEDPYRNEENRHALEQKVGLDIGFQLTNSGKWTDEQFGKWAREHNLLPSELIDKETGKPIGNDQTLGEELWCAHGLPNDYELGSATREELAEKEAQKLASDPVLREHRETERQTKVTEAQAAEWRKSEEEHRLSGSPLGRQRLAEQRAEQRRAEEARRDAEVLREAASDLAQNNMPTEAVRERLAKIAEVRGPSESEAIALIKNARQGGSEPTLGQILDGVLAAAPANSNPPLVQNNTGGQSNG